MRTLTLLILMVLPGAVDAKTRASPRPNPEGVAFSSTSWTEIRRVSGIDPSVLAALKSLLGRDSRLADVGQPFEATDVVGSNPTRRLVVAGRAASRWFVCYEHGGFGHHLDLAIFDTSGSSPRPVLVARGDGGIHDDVKGWQLTLEDIGKALQSGRLRVEPRIPSQIF